MTYKHSCLFPLPTEYHLKIIVKKYNHKIAMTVRTEGEGSQMTWIVKLGPGVRNRT